jgi:hypothetical protein
MSTTAGPTVPGLVDDVMTQEPYRSARRIFWVMDNGSAHRGAKADARLQARWHTLQPVQTPLHASWLNQIEIDFSIVQRKVLTPNDFATVTALEHDLRGFQHRYQAMAQPFRWTFTRADLQQLLPPTKGHRLDFADVALTSYAGLALFGQYLRATGFNATARAAWAGTAGWGVGLANIASSQEVIDVGVPGRHSTGDASRHQDGGCGPIGPGDASRFPARDSCPAPPARRSRSIDEALSPS